MFIVTMAKLNVRLRTRLFHSLLLQDIAFFDKNRWVGGREGGWVRLCHQLDVGIVTPPSVSPRSSRGQHPRL